MQLVRLPLREAGAEVRMVESLAPMWAEEQQRCGPSGIPPPPASPPRTPRPLCAAVGAVREQFEAIAEQQRQRGLMPPETELQPDQQQQPRQTPEQAQQQQQQHHQQQDEEEERAERAAGGKDGAPAGWEQEQAPQATPGFPAPAAPPGGTIGPGGVGASPFTPWASMRPPAQQQVPPSSALLAMTQPANRAALTTPRRPAVMLAAEPGAASPLTGSGGPGVGRFWRQRQPQVQQARQGWDSTPASMVVSQQHGPPRQQQHEPLGPGGQQLWEQKQQQEQEQEEGQQVGEAELEGLVDECILMTQLRQHRRQQQQNLRGHGGEGEADGEEEEEEEAGEGGEKGEALGGAAGSQRETSAALAAWLRRRQEAAEDGLASSGDDHSSDGHGVAEEEEEEGHGAEVAGEGAGGDPAEEGQEGDELLLALAARAAGGTPSSAPGSTAGGGGSQCTLHRNGRRSSASWLRRGGSGRGTPTSSQWGSQQEQGEAAAQVRGGAACIIVGLDSPIRHLSIQRAFTHTVRPMHTRSADCHLLPTAESPGAVPLCHPARVWGHP